MGTNYYLLQNVCGHCGRGDDRLHIGKSSMGWCFSLHVDPQLGINDLPDWENRWSQPDTKIEDEYGRALTVPDMRAVILARAGKDFDDGRKWWMGYDSEADFHARNHSERGPAGLLRHRLGQYCVGHGSGTYDLMRGEFS